MKIIGLTTRIIEFDASSRFGDKPVPRNSPHTWKYPLITIHTDEGIDGYSMIYGPHGDGPAMAEILQASYLPDILGENPLHTESIWQKLRAKNRHLYNLSNSLMGVIDVALWDVKGKILDKPIAVLLGLYREQIKTYATGRVYLPTDEEIYEEAKAIKDAGFYGYKLQLWQGPAKDIPRYHAAREAVGDNFVLMEDASGGYTYAEAFRVGKVLEKLNFYWFEEPIRDRQLELLRRLDKEINIPLLIGETLSLEEIPGLFQVQPFGFVRGDVLIKGGITGLQKMFGLCGLYGSNLEIHSAGTPLLDVANLHVACANKNCEFIELHHPVFRFGLLNSPLNKDDRGFLHVPMKPGLGVTLDWDWIDDHQTRIISTLSGPNSAK